MRERNGAGQLMDHGREVVVQGDDGSFYVILTELDALLNAKPQRVQNVLRACNAERC
jgi:hypothetical protein